MQSVVAESLSKVLPNKMFAFGFVQWASSLGIEVKKNRGNIQKAMISMIFTFLKQPKLAYLLYFWYSIRLIFTCLCVLFLCRMGFFFSL